MTAPTTPALLYLDAVTVSFDGFRALNALSLMVDQAEMRAIIGPNGAGKTTMMDVITGKTRPTTGTAVFAGSHDLTRLDEAEIAELGIGRKFQTPTVFDMHTVEDNLRLALKADRRPFPTLFSRGTVPERERIDALSSASASRITAPARPPSCRTGRSNGWRSACCSPRSRSSSSWTSPPRA
jgi:urea transport system ATP-binding protein